MGIRYSPGAQGMFDAVRTKCAGAALVVCLMSNSEGGGMFGIHARVLLLWLTAGLTAINAQQYTISTYAGGAPPSATAAMSMAADASGNLYFVDGYGYTSNPLRSASVFKIDPSGAITR